MHEILNQQQIHDFIHDGFVRIDNVFSSEVAKEARAILWHDLPGNPNDPDTWKQPVVWLGMYSQPPFVRATNNEVLHGAFDQLVGKGKWTPCMSVRAFPFRFAFTVDSGDSGWHVDAGFPGADQIGRAHV